MLMAIVVYLGIGAIGLYLVRAKLNRLVSGSSPLVKIICYVHWTVIAPVVMIIGFCKAIFNDITKRES